MSFSLSQVVQDVENIVGLLAPAASLVTAVAAVAPAGTPASKILNSAQAGLTSAVSNAGGIAADVAAIWPHLQSILTAAEGVFEAFEGKVAAAVSHTASLEPTSAPIPEPAQ